jgi:hypothetical protein
MLDVLVGVLVLSLIQTAALVRVYLRTRETERLDDRLAHFAEALALLTDTTEAGFTNIAGELEARRKTSRANSRAATSKRIVTAVRRGRSIDDIAASESLSESEIRLHLGLSTTGAGAPAGERRGARTRATRHLEARPPDPADPLQGDAGGDMA